MNISDAVKHIADDCYRLKTKMSGWETLVCPGDHVAVNFPDLSENAARENAQSAGAIRDRAEAMDQSNLTHDDEILLDIVKFRCDAIISDYKFYWSKFVTEPWMNVFPLSFNYLKNYPPADPIHLTSYMKLLESLSQMVAQQKEKTECQAEIGAFLPRRVIENAVAMYQGFIISLKDHPLVLTKEKLAGIDAADVDTAITGSRQMVRALNDLLREMVTFLDGAYKENAPKTVSIRQYPGGEAFYKENVKYHTTLDMTPEEIFTLAETHRNINLERMEAIRKSLGFDGTMSEFTDMVLKDPTRAMKTPEVFGERLNAYLHKILPLLKDYFIDIPKAECLATRMAPEMEPQLEYGFYSPPMPPVKPMGNYFYNGANIENRDPCDIPPLAYHEMTPGHHFQIALTMENEDLHPLARASLVTAYTEGWAEYAAILAGEMGMYEDLYAEYGRLQMDLILINFLTIDTGIHAKGWSLEEAMDFLGKYKPDLDEKSRFNLIGLSSLANPGFVLAYKIGSLKMMEIREKAKAALGDKFDIRKYHRTILEWGSLPLLILEKHVDRIVEKVKNRT
ncbi:MAG: DUF885 domain-containing protein [Deltaproteobacteria bacterium]|nr:DUF885 domain-containing protein [Deltaproteobacteria bacterium]